MPDRPDQPHWVTIQIANDRPGWDTTWNVEKAIWIRIHNSTASPAVLHATGQSAWRWYKRWLLPEDAPSNPQELQPLPNGFPYQPQVTPLPPNPDPKTLAKLKPVTHCTLLDRMQEIAAKLHIPLLATLPMTQNRFTANLPSTRPKPSPTTSRASPPTPKNGSTISGTVDCSSLATHDGHSTKPLPSPNTSSNSSEKTSNNKASSPSHSFGSSLPR